MPVITLRNLTNRELISYAEHQDSLTALEHELVKRLEDSFPNYIPANPNQTKLDLSSGEARHG